MTDKVTNANPENLSGVSLGVRRHLRGTPATAQEGNLPTAQVAWFIALHIPLMMIFRAAPVVATIHSVAVVLFGTVYLLQDKSPVRAVGILAYIAGAEILWRGVEAAPVWEYGKYATLLLCLLLILKYRKFNRTSLWPLLFIALLIPGIFVAPAFNRDDISYQLAGPVALAAASWALGGMELKRADLQRIFLNLIAPTFAMGTLVIVMLATNNITFYAGGENELVTDWIGANQVSSALSLGATAAFFYALLSEKNRPMRNAMILMALALLALSVLTFSRAGLWNMLGAVIAGMLFLMRNLRQGVRAFGALAATGALAYLVIYPLLLNLTGGTVLSRFSDFDTTGRDIIARIDYNLFLKNPIWGVGVGQSVPAHNQYFGSLRRTHTEYTRLLAEHGLFGAVVILILAIIVLFRATRRFPALAKSISMGFTAWTLLYFVHSATRMVAPSFLFGLAGARLLPEEESPPRG